MPVVETRNQNFTHAESSNRKLQNDFLQGSPGHFFRSLDGPGSKLRYLPAAGCLRIYLGASPSPEETLCSAWDAQAGTPAGCLSGAALAFSAGSWKCLIRRCHVCACDDVMRVLVMISCVLLVTMSCVLVTMSCMCL